MKNSPSVFWPPALSCLIAIFLCALSSTARAQATVIKYLSGTDKDHTVQWDFFCTKGNNSGVWSKIQVPSCWELQGFGTYNYGTVPINKQADETGMYKYEFIAEKSWEKQDVNIVFEAVMTDAEVKINGKPAGKIHQGAFYQFSYDISSLLQYGKKNLLEVKVNKLSANRSVSIAEHQADYWVFGGIFRPVYLEILPPRHIKRVAVNASASGQFNAQVFISKNNKGNRIEATVYKAGSNQVIQTLVAPVNDNDTLVNLKKSFAHIDQWSPEFPDLYRLKVAIKNSTGNVIHTVTQKFGFRTVELRPHDGIFLNDQKVVFKGVNHHSFWPESGRTTSKKLSIEDVKLMKDMNMNAVRMSHYPPDGHFLDVCDSLGLMVLDELTGWQHNYDDSTGHRLVKEMVIKDVNHPSIVLWDNGNEGGFNRNLDNDFKIYDPQNRHVIHPWEKFNGTNTRHYPTYNDAENSALYDNDIYFPTEFMHGLYDGGHGAGLEDFWNLILRHPRGAGGFLWVFADEGVLRRDKKDSIDTYTNNAPDGIVGPFHEKEGSYYTIKEIWSPISIAMPYIPQKFSGQIRVENRYMFTNLNRCSFKWKLVSFNGPAGPKKVNASGSATSVAVEPGSQGNLKLNLPASWRNSEALYLTAYDLYNKEIFTWSWPIKDAAAITRKYIKQTGGSPLKITEDAQGLVIDNNGVTTTFDKATGYLVNVKRGGQELPFANGPALAGISQELESFKSVKEGEKLIVNVKYKGKNNGLEATWTFAPGMPVKLSYSYRQRGEADFMGITFNLPEELVTGMQWQGRGPYHVWKNRLKGQQYGVWEKDYNETVTGEKLWKYPEFKGNHAQVNWVKIKTRKFNFRVFSESDNLFLQMLKPAPPKGAFNKNTTVNYPDGNIGFLDAIQPIGTKFQAAADMGPQSQKNLPLNTTPVSHTLWFDFNG